MKLCSESTNVAELLKVPWKVARSPVMLWSSVQAETLVLLVYTHAYTAAGTSTSCSRFHTTVLIDSRWL